jgi:ABC-2 type transport system permease protein
MTSLTLTLSASCALAHRELLRFIRQPNRVVGALLTPIVFWLLIGFGMGRSFQADGVAGGYLEYFFPGSLLMIVLFTAIFSTISIIEDRREGFLQSVLVSPVSCRPIVLGKVAGGTVLATAQATIFLALAPAAGIRLSVASVSLTILTVLIVALALTSLGIIMAWRMSSTQGFHAVMNLVLMPMWFLSGALFPIRQEMASSLQAVMLANPLTYCLASIRSAMYLPQAGWDGNWGINLAVSLVFAAAALMAAIWISSTRTQDDLQ